MLIALCLATMLVACVFIWRGLDVRAVLLAASLAIGLFAGHPGVC